MPAKPRTIDRLPVPKAPRKMKVVILSASRTGTLGLYSAMQTLGYKPIHMKEVAIAGADSMRILCEGIQADKNRLSGIKRYDEQDFRRWFAEYDCIVEVCCFFDSSTMTRIANTYLADPDVKFILTERSPSSWARSVNNSVYKNAIATLTAFPINILRRFDDFLNMFVLVNEVIYAGWSRNTIPGEPGNTENLEEFYADYIRTVKETVPKDRLKVIHLDNGLDWNSICPFLGVPVPKEPYPDRNEPEKFAALVAKHIFPKVRNAALKLVVSVITPATVAWAMWRYTSGAGLPSLW